jgi:hypothetical protein
MRKKPVKFDHQKARTLRDSGLTLEEIGKELNCATITCAKHLANYNPKSFETTENLPLVYEFLDSKGEVIYIGQSIGISRRMLQHKHKSSFYCEIETIICYCFESFPDMAFYEAQCIINKKPKYNVKIKESVPSKHNIEPVRKLVFNIRGFKIS